jgi:hypothetical protein
VAKESGRIRIGTAGKQTAAFLAGVNGVAIPGPVKTVVINGNGQLGTAKAATATSARAGAGGDDVRALRKKIDDQAAQLRELKAEVGQMRALMRRRS